MRQRDARGAGVRRGRVPAQQPPREVLTARCAMHHDALARGEQRADPVGVVKMLVVLREERVDRVHHAGDLRGVELGGPEVVGRHGLLHAEGGDIVRLCMATDNNCERRRPRGDGGVTT